MSSEPLTPMRRWTCDRCRVAVDMPVEIAPARWWRARVERERHMVDEVDWCEPCGKQVYQHFRRVEP